MFIEVFANAMPSGKIAEKAVFLTTWHCILKQKTHSFRLFFWRICPLRWNRSKIWEYPLCWNPKGRAIDQNALHLPKRR